MQVCPKGFRHITPITAAHRPLTLDTAILVPPRRSPRSVRATASCRPRLICSLTREQPRAISEFTLPASLGQDDRAAGHRGRLDLVAANQSHDCDPALRSSAATLRGGTCHTMRRLPRRGYRARRAPSRPHPICGGHERSDKQQLQDADHAENNLSIGCTSHRDAAADCRQRALRRRSDALPTTIAQPCSNVSDPYDIGPCCIAKRGGHSRWAFRCRIDHSP